MLFRNFERLLNTVYTTRIDRFRNLFLPFDLGFHLHGTRSPGTFNSSFRWLAARWLANATY